MSITFGSYIREKRNTISTYKQEGMTEAEVARNL